MAHWLTEEEPRKWGWLWAVVAESREGSGRQRRALPRERLVKAFELTGEQIRDELLCPPEFGEDGSAQALLSGVGFGEVEVGATEHGTELRGEALDRARSALWDARRHRRHVLVRGPGGAEEEALSSLLEMMAELRHGWTARQAEIVRLARVANGRTVARRLGVGPSVVSESLTAASFRSLCRAEQAVTALGRCFGSAASPVPLPARFPAITEAPREQSALRAAAARQ